MVQHRPLVFFLNYARIHTCVVCWQIFPNDSAGAMICHTKSISETICLTFFSGFQNQK